ncbi:MAG: hypothetical protein LBU47_03745 [Christensenellaceae bacterium]|jgi:hypothetical protein|nr:hypothetical protein [Christensenellaceae bacterium]
MFVLCAMLMALCGLPYTIGYMKNGKGGKLTKACALLVQILGILFPLLFIGIT